MGYTWETYQEFLESPEWKRTCLRLKRECDWTCQDCYTRQHDLHVHHTTYKNGWMPLDDEGLIVLCPECHDERHGQTSGTWSDIQRRLDQLGSRI